MARNRVLTVTLSEEDLKHLDFLEQYYLNTRGFKYSKSMVMKAAMAELFMKYKKEEEK